MTKLLKFEAKIIRKILKIKEKGGFVGDQLKDRISEVLYNRLIVLFCLAQVRDNSTSSILKAVFRGFSVR